MNVSEVSAKAAIELSNTLSQVDENSIEELMDAIYSSKKIFVVGAGRSLLMLRGLAMRLMHIGYTSYVVGDTTTPAFEAEDLLIVGSGSGETSGLVNVAAKAKKIGGKVALITIREDSTLAKLSDIHIIVPAYTDKVVDGNMVKPILPGGTMFEQAMLFIGDTMILPLAEKTNIPTDRVFSRHANLE